MCKMYILWGKNRRKRKKDSLFISPPSDNYVFKIGMLFEIILYKYIGSMDMLIYFKTKIGPYYIFCNFTCLFFHFKIHHGHLYWVKKKKKKEEEKTLGGEGAESGEGEKRRKKEKKYIIILLCLRVFPEWTSSSCWIWMLLSVYLLQSIHVDTLNLFSILTNFLRVN